MKVQMTPNLMTICLAVSLLIACDKSSTAASAISASNGSGSYEVVLVTQPEPLAPYLQKTYIGAYDLCAAGAAIAKLPVAPFPGIPADFFEERKTYIRDGRNFIEKKKRM